MNELFKISIIINILFILFGGYIIHKKGGIDYLKTKFNTLTKTTVEKDYGDFYQIKRSIFKILPNETNEIIFLGNSITTFCAWNELFGKANIKNRGISGDMINGVIDRLNEIVESKPVKIFLMIGINDLGKKRSVNQILADYEKLVSLIINKSPKTKLYLQSILPTKNRKTMKNNDIIEINKGIIKIANKYSLTYINLFDLFKTNENELNMKYSLDGLHINGQGYVLWKNAIIDNIEN
ncbi:GDSL-type esterase/lipase family protein [Lutibacter citreus]|uniref:GDSL-type esterase/lipase family protein n=1 Tax=Lutibacter citreus TaxID=2138210 RepID=UPI0013001B17|nr:GDSL-type esterase/lipase family protein [Lutibacter citreus]